jgi:hypothetical protein
MLEKSTLIALGVVFGVGVPVTTGLLLFYVFHYRRKRASDVENDCEPLRRDDTFFSESKDSVSIDEKLSFDDDRPLPYLNYPEPCAHVARKTSSLDSLVDSVLKDSLESCGRRRHNVYQCLERWKAHQKNLRADQESAKPDGWKQEPDTVIDPLSRNAIRFSTIEISLGSVVYPHYGSDEDGASDDRNSSSPQQEYHPSDASTHSTAEDEATLPHSAIEASPSSPQDGSQPGKSYQCGYCAEDFDRAYKLK